MATQSRDWEGAEHPQTILCADLKCALQKNYVRRVTLVSFFPSATTVALSFYHLYECGEIIRHLNWAPGNAYPGACAAVGRENNTPFVWTFRSAFPC